jgi:hypothetical protein
MGYRAPGDCAVAHEFGFGEGNAGAGGRGEAGTRSSDVGSSGRRTTLVGLLPAPVAATPNFLRWTQLGRELPGECAFFPIRGRVVSGHEFHPLDALVGWASEKRPPQRIKGDCQRGGRITHQRERLPATERMMVEARTEITAITTPSCTVLNQDGAADRRLRCERHRKPQNTVGRPPCNRESSSIVPGTRVRG